MHARSNRYHVASHDPVAVLYNAAGSVRKSSVGPSSSLTLGRKHRIHPKQLRGSIAWDACDSGLGKDRLLLPDCQDQSPLENMHCTIGRSPGLGNGMYPAASLATNCHTLYSPGSTLVATCSFACLATQKDIHKSELAKDDRSVRVA